MNDGSELKYVREYMGQGEVSLEMMAARLGCTPAELAAMEAGGPAPDYYFDAALVYIGELAERDAERERRARDN